MNARKAMLFAAVAGLAGVAAYFWKQQQAGDDDLPKPHLVNTNRGHAKVVKSVEKTLHAHEGEDSPVVQAFQEALHTDN